MEEGLVGKSKCIVDVEDNRIRIGGSLVESFPRDMVRREVEKLIFARKYIIFDFEKLKNVSSIGIGLLCNVMNLRPLGRFENVPLILAEQISMLPNLVPDPILVESLILPFSVVGRSQRVLKKVIIGKDIPILDSYSDVEVTLQEGNQQLEPEFLADLFSFVAQDPIRYRISYLGNGGFANRPA